MIRVDLATKLKGQIYDPSRSLDKIEGLDLWSEWISDRDPWDRIQGCGVGVGVGVGVGRSRQLWPESESESESILETRAGVGVGVTENLSTPQPC